AAFLAGPEPTRGALAALWWDARGDWGRAHRAAQADSTPAGAAVHAYLHRKEPDPDNARYWYARAGRDEAKIPLDAERDALLGELLATTTTEGERR
ncbi:MAG: hypothetical protein KGI51_14040, partial [Rhodospirillales bacterium]|nr:hypothetical protein [Rhodospirillales bacterium]